MSVRIAVIGTGVMGRDHARILAEDIPGASLQVVCDVSEAAAKSTADAYSAADWASDAISTIRRDDVDAVVIASPDNSHAPLTLAALALEKPVLCEKPLAVSTSECLEVVQAECSIGKQLVQVGFMRRYDPAYAAMKSACQSGELGAALLMHNFHRNVVAPPHFSGQMAITNSAPHEFDIARYILSAELVEVNAFEPGTTSLSEDVCKPVVLILESAHGQLVTVEVNNNAAYGYDVRCELVGASASVSLGNNVALRTDRDLSCSTEHAEDWRSRFAEAYRLQNKAWVRSIRSGKPDTAGANAWDGYCATAIAEAGVAALQSGSKKAIRLIRQPALYENTEQAA